MGVLAMAQDHIHVVLLIPPKFSVSSFMGFLNGKLSVPSFPLIKGLGKRYWADIFGAVARCERRWLGRREDSQVRKLSGAQES